MSTLLSEEELAAALRQIAEQEKAERRDSDFARRSQQSEKENTLSSAHSNMPPASSSQLPPERKADAEMLAQQLKDEEYARSLNEALNAGGSSEHARGDRKRNTEDDVLRELQLAQEQTEKDALLAQALSNESNVAREDTSNDALLAQEYARQFDEKNKIERITSELENDAEMARALQDAEGNSPRQRNMLHQFNNVFINRSMVSDEAWKKIAAELQPILDSNAVVGDPINPKNPKLLTDAHKYTRTLICAGIPKLFAMDKQFKLSDDSLKPEQVLKEVLAFLESAGVDPNHAQIKNIKGTFARVAKAPAVDAAETKANVHHLLSRVWTLAKKWGPAYMDAIATCLSDNIADKGGCIPGLIARLYSPYAKILGLELGMAPKVQREVPKAAKN